MDANRPILISGTSSFFVIEMEDARVFLIGDKHTNSALGSCQEEIGCECDSVNPSLRDVSVRPNSSCWSIGALLIEWFTYNRDAGVSTDYYVELPFTKIERKSSYNPSDHSSSEDDVYRIPTGLWLTTIGDMFRPCLTRSKEDCPYGPAVRFHYSDVRQLENSEYSSDLFDLTDYPKEYELVKEVSLQQARLEAEQIISLVEFLEHHGPSIYREIYFNQDMSARIDKYRKVLDIGTVTGQVWNKKLDAVLSQRVKRGDLMVDRSLAALNKLDIIRPVQHHAILAYIEDQLSVSKATSHGSAGLIGTLRAVLESSKLDDSPKHLLRTLSKVLSLFQLVMNGVVEILRMDVYALCRMLTQQAIRNSPEIILHCGNTHIEHYVAFLNKYLSFPLLYSREYSDRSKCVNIAGAERFLNPRVFRSYYVNVMPSAIRTISCVDPVTRQEIVRHLRQRGKAVVLGDYSHIEEATAFFYESRRGVTVVSELSCRMSEDGELLFLTSRTKVSEWVNLGDKLDLFSRYNILLQRGCGEAAASSLTKEFSDYYHVKLSNSPSFPEVARAFFVICVGSSVDSSVPLFDNGFALILDEESDLEILRYTLQVAIQSIEREVDRMIE